MKRYMSLSWIVRLFICLFALLLVGMLGIFNYHYYHRSEQDARKFAEQSLDETARLLDAQITGIVTTMQSIAFDGGGSQFCVSGHAWRNENQHYIRTQLNQLALDSTIIQLAALYTMDGAYCAADNQTGQNPHILFRHLNEELQISLPFRKTLYSPPMDVNGNILITAVVPIWDQAGSRGTSYNCCGVIVVQFNILNLLEQVNVTSRPLKLLFSNGMIADTETHTLSPSSVSGIDARMLSYDMRNYGWTLYHSDVTHDHSANIRQMIQFTLFVGLLMLALHIAFIYLFQRMVVLPIEKLAAIVRNSTSHNLAIGEDISSRNELALLTHSINEMLERIRRSNEEQAQRLRERATFMQARINPHFLYNNLECIRGMAVMRQYGAIRELTGVMADIYRYCNHSDPCVLLQEELKCAEKYIRLLSLRYPDRLTLEVEVEEHALACRVPRMCLQPLMENSIYHGILEVGKQNGTLMLHARVQDGRLRITLADDGCGMTQEQYDQVNRIARDDEYAVKHIGIGNVRSRLVLLCGDDSTLILRSGENGGVTAEINICANM